MTDIVPWWRSTQMERQSVAVARQTGREMVLGQALDRIRADGLHERIENAYELGQHAVVRMVEFDELVERALQLRPRLEPHVLEIEDTLTLGVREVILRYVTT